MKETQVSESGIEEESDMYRAHDMDVEKILVDLLDLREAHKDQNNNNLTICKLRKLHRDMVKVKGASSSKGSGEVVSRNLGINNNLLNAQKKIHREEKNKGRKSLRQKIE